jgi:hypothetical protein
MVNILPTESVEFLSLENYEIELELVLKKDDYYVGNWMDGMTWKVYSSSNFDDVILTRWDQWHIRHLLMLPLCFSSWIYSSGNCVFSLARLSIYDAQRVHHKSSLSFTWSRLQRVCEELSKSDVCIYIFTFVWKP